MKEQRPSETTRVSSWLSTMSGLILLLISSLTLQNLCWILSVQTPAVGAVSWDEWWTYEGISGPAFWGLMNPDWAMCNRGRRQSPINIEPSQLLFDPNLRSLHIDKNAVIGHLSNVGQGVVFTVDNSSKPSVNVTGGPLSYRYEWSQMTLHFGLSNQTGSEHTIAGRAFPAELQIYGFNSQLYSTYNEALDSPHGIVAIAVLIQIGDATSQSSEFSLLLEHIAKIDRHAGHGSNKVKRGLLQPGQERSVPPISLRQLLPKTDHYITYDGSSTTPACQETATWILLNRPLYITEQQLYALRGLKRGSSSSINHHHQATNNGKTPPSSSSSSSSSLATANSADPMGNNYRPVQPTHHRAVRTNIDFTGSSSPTSFQNKETAVSSCASMHRDMNYKANTFWRP